MTYSPPSTAVSSTVSTSSSAPMFAPISDASPSARSEPGNSTRNDEKVSWRDSENDDGAVMIHVHSSSAGKVSGKRSGMKQSKSFHVTLPPNTGLEDMESPRLQEILRVTNGRHRKKGTYTKSLSLELSYRAVHAQLEDAKLMIREKFNKAKEEINVELALFENELVTTLKQTEESHPEWKKDLEDMLLVARQSAQMSTEEFWFKCEGIVVNLDQRRQQLPTGLVKQAHTRLLFILTRCTRLVQCQ